MSIDEYHLIRKAQDGDTESFGTLVSLYQDRAFSVATGILGNSHDAMDVVQDAFIKAFRNIGKFNFSSTFNTWLHRIVINTSIDELRKRKHHSQVVSLDRSYESEDGEYTVQYEDTESYVEEILERKESIDLLKKALETIEEDHRMVIVLSDIKGYSYQEISTILDLPLGTVKSRIARARAKLVEMLKRDGTNPNPFR